MIADVMHALTSPCAARARHSGHGNQSSVATTTGIFSIVTYFTGMFVFFNFGRNWPYIVLPMHSFREAI